jgi:hypothetical protein
MSLNPAVCKSKGLLLESVTAFDEKIYGLGRKMVMENIFLIFIFF